MIEQLNALLREIVLENAEEIAIGVADQSVEAASLHSSEDVRAFEAAVMNLPASDPA